MLVCMSVYEWVKERWINCDSICGHNDKSLLIECNGIVKDRETELDEIEIEA